MELLDFPESMTKTYQRKKERKSSCYQKCNVGPTKTSPRKVKTKVLLTSQLGTRSISS